MATLIPCRYSLDLNVGYFRPMVRIRIHNKTATRNGRVETVWALVDSGAHRCCLPKWIADEIGHNWSKGKAFEVTGVSGVPTLSYLHTAHIELADYPGKDFQTKVAVVDRPRQNAGGKGRSEKGSLRMDYAILG